MIKALKLHGQDVWVRGTCPTCGEMVSFVIRSLPHEYHSTAPCHVCLEPIPIGLVVQQVLRPSFITVGR